MTETISEPTAPAPPPVDNTEPAPWGRKADGTPRAKPGRPPNPGSGSARKSSPSSGARKTGAKGATDYRPGIEGIFQLVALPLAFKFPADAIVVTTYAPGIAEALNDLAALKPEVAAALDRVLSAGPYGALLAACLPMVIQLLVNHDVIPVDSVRSFGALSVDEILARTA